MDEALFLWGDVVFVARNGNVVILSRIRDGGDADATFLANAMDAVTIPLFAGVLFR